MAVVYYRRTRDLLNRDVLMAVCNTQAASESATLSDIYHVPTFAIPSLHHTMPLIPVGLRQQLATLPPLVHANLVEKTVVIVGASNGIGLEAAKHFARMKPGRLILACRDQARGEAALAGEYVLLADVRYERRLLQR